MAKWQRTNIKIPKGYNPAERRAIAREVIDFIVERTKSGRNKDNRPFKGYSKSYKNSKTFRIGGKSRGKVDLTLTGEMLGALKLLDQSSGNLRIGYDKTRRDLNGKVEGNREGTYGNRRPVTSKRDFLGITQKALDEILRKYPLKDKEEREERTENIEKSTSLTNLLSLNELNRRNDE